MKIFVTGADGFIGSHFVRLCKIRGFEVIPISLRKKNKKYLEVGELLRNKSKMIFEEDVFVHLAAVGNRPNSHSDRFIMDFNFIHSKEILSELSESAMRKFIIVGSGIEYGKTLSVKSPRTTDFLEPVGAYAASKAKLSSWVTSELREPYSYLRLFQVYGLNNYSDRLDTTIRNAIELGQRIKIATPGNICDFIHVCDVAEFMLSECEDIQSSGILNVCTGEGTSVLDFALSATRQLLSKNKISIVSEIKIEETFAFNERYVGTPSEKVKFKSIFRPISEITEDELFNNLISCRCN